MSIEIVSSSATNELVMLTNMNTIICTACFNIAMKALTATSSTRSVHNINQRLQLAVRKLSFLPRFLQIIYQATNLIRKIKWRVHQSHNTRFTWKTPNLEKNHGRCHKTTREKYSLCKKLLQPLSEIKFLSPKPQIHNPEKYPLTNQTRNTHIEEPTSHSI